MERTVKHFLCIAGLLGALLLGIAGVARSVSDRATWSPADGADAAEGIVNDNLPGQHILLAPYRAVNALLGTHVFSNGSAVLDESGSTYLQRASAINPTPIVSGIEDLQAFCDGHGIQLLYVILPSKPLDDGDLGHLGIPSNRNANADGVAQGLEEAGVHVLDLRESYSCEDGYSRWFYASDHHWNTEAGLFGARLIAEELNNSYGYDFDLALIADENLSRTVYEDCWVGELGNKALGPFGPHDDYTVIEPSYDTHLHYTVPSSGIDSYGGFEILTVPSRLESNHLTDGTSLHYYFFGGNSALAIIENQDAASGNLLVIKDSYVCSCAPFLSLLTERLTLWDDRYSPGLYDYLEQHPEIETVVVMYSLGFVGKADMNTFD